MSMFVLPEDEPYQAALTELARVPRYPFDEAKDLRFVRELAQQFPEVDLVDEIQKWRIYLIDHEPEGKVNWRGRFRNWVAIERRGRGGRTRSSNGRQVVRANRAGYATRPGTADEHGESSDRLEDL